MAFGYTDLLQGERIESHVVDPASICDVASAPTGED